MSNQETPKPKEKLSTEAFFAQNLPVLRLRLAELEMTQDQLAKAVGVTQATISKILAGERQPGRELAQKILAHVGDLTDVARAAGPYYQDAIERFAASDVDARPKGLVDFMSRRGEALKITHREYLALLGLRFLTVPWIITDDKFWELQLNCWRQILEDQDKRPANVQYLDLF